MAAAYGLLCVDKPGGMTSHDVVSVVRRLLGTKRVGHTGTLDPEATGVLVVCVGAATRLAEYLSASRKHYSTEVTLGIETDTEDIWGSVLAERDATGVRCEDVVAALPGFRGDIMQVPPMVSARRHEGQRLYELARRGVTVERAARCVQIDELTLSTFEPGVRAVAHLEVTCSSGTYIRALAADIGCAVGVGGAMSMLRRTWVGDSAYHFDVQSAHTLDELTTRASEGAINGALLPMEAATAGWPSVRLNGFDLAAVRRGQPVGAAGLSPAVAAEGLAETVRRSCVVADKADDIDAPARWLPIALLDDSGALQAVGRVVGDQIRPVKVFLPDDSV